MACGELRWLLENRVHGILFRSVLQLVAGDIYALSMMLPYYLLYAYMLLTQNVHSAPITQQAEKLSFARAEKK
jgi:hypothetical protein